MEYTVFRNRYKKFIYHSYTIEDTDDTFKATFDFEIVNLAHFYPTFTVRKPHNIPLADIRLVKNAVFHLGLIELISYWKLTCARDVMIEAGHLDDTQTKWWKKLYFHGLGEFFYKNNIDLKEDTFMQITSSCKTIEGEDYPLEVHGNLIPVGGGKDSFVTLSLLKDSFADNHAFVINKVISALHASDSAGYTGDKLINPIRTLDLTMLKLNAKGFLNGHTPFSAMAAFASYLTAVIYGKKYICLSNEDSANESTIKSSTVNHQYSKSFAFEKDFQKYVEKYLDGRIYYFSMLRGLSELQIAGIFAEEKQWLSVFRSCNVGQKEGVWCGKCAKCLFVAVMMSAYLEEAEVIRIFGRDILNDEEMKPLFEQLTGMVDDKPFECVGTRDEVNIAVAMAIQKYGNKQLPYLYQYYKTTTYYTYYKDRRVDWTSYNQANSLPERFDTLVRNRMKEML